MSPRLRAWIAAAVILVILAGAVILAPQIVGGENGNDAAVVAAEKTAAREVAEEGADGPAATAAIPSPVARTPSPGTGRTAVPPTRGATGAGAGSYDLERDEARGGHTLSRHVGRTEADLRDRLQSEPDISAASSYTDVAAAETTVGRALDQGKKAIADWLKKGDQRANLVLRVSMPETVGISLTRGAKTARTVKSAVVVLRARGSDWYVLTSYPEDR